MYPAKKRQREHSINGLTPLPKRATATVHGQSGSRASLETVETTDETEDESLCQSCGSIDFRQLYDLEITDKDGIHILDIGALPAELLSSACPFCRLMASSARLSTQFVESTAYSLRAFPSLPAIGNLINRRNAQFMHDIPPSSVLGITETSNESRPIYYSAENDEPHSLPSKPVAFLSKATASGSQGYDGVRGRIVNRNSADLQLVRQWLDFCKMNHQKTCVLLDTVHLSFLKVIDCARRVVLDAPPSCRYAALSYVWGPREKTVDAATLRLGENGELPNILPQVVEDALQATKELGLHYLWVDRFCITQHDEIDKISQMSNMHRIYNQAELTIVAAAGEDSSYGLAGLSKPRTEQPSGIVSGINIVSTLADPHEAVQLSKWMTRAWVYQEFLFSLRRVVFTQEQVYFECNNMHCCEAVSIPLLAYHTADKRRFRTCFKHGLGRGGFGKRRWPMTSHIQKYSEKALTFENDALKGMLGIFKAFETAGSNPVHQIWGVPIEFDMDTAHWKSQTRIKHQYLAKPWMLSASFARALSWNLKHPCQRRVSFPSWSWTGWAGPLRDWPSFEMFSNMENPEIRFRLKTVKGRLLELHQMMGSMRGDTLAQDSLNLEVEAWTFEIEVRRIARPDLPVEVSQSADDFEPFALVKTMDSQEVFSPIYFCKENDESSHGSTKTCAILSYRKQACRSPIGILVQQNGDAQNRLALVDFSVSWSKVDGNWDRFVLDDRRCPRERRRFTLR